MIRIISGVSCPGGSTVAHINLCNAFNASGHDCIFYGPHDWHLDKCRAAPVSEVVLRPDDVLLVHFLEPRPRPAVRRYVLSCHETDAYPLRSVRHDVYDFIHFVSEFQRDWHGVSHPSVVIPNVITPLRRSRRAADGRRIAGVIGTVYPHKQTHVSIARALSDGCHEVLVFGRYDMNDDYYRNCIAPIMHAHPGRVRMMGHVDDTQTVYDSIDVAYHSSLRETFNYIKAECLAAGVRYEGVETAESHAEQAMPDAVVQRWIECLGPV